jgi:hypothetical protein
MAVWEVIDHQLAAIHLLKSPVKSLADLVQLQIARSVNR